MLFQHIGHGQRIDGSGKHSHMVGPAALHPVAAVFQPPPEVAAAHHNAYLNTSLHTLFNDLGHLSDHVKIQSPPCVARQGLSADFQQHSAIDRLFHICHSLQ